MLYYFRYFLFTFLLSSIVFGQDNDDINNAIQVVCNTQISSSTSGFNSDQSLLIENDLNDCGTSVDASAGIWYFFEGSDQDISINTCNSSFDTKVHIFSDNGFALSCVTGNDDSDCESSYLHSKVNFYAQIELTYFIYISGYSTNEGDFNLLIECFDPGCTDQNATNFCETCITDDGSCIYDLGCTDQNATNFCENCITDDGSCEYILGCTVEAALNFNELATQDDGSCLYDMGCGSDEIQVDILITTDSYPSETSFSLIDNQGVIWVNQDSNSMLVDQYQPYPFQYCLPEEGCYIFTIYDSYGDGIFSGGGLIVNYNFETVLENPDFSNDYSINMNCPPGYDCNTAIDINLGEYITETNDYWYVFSPQYNGQYDINSCLSDCNTIIYVYDYCTGLLPTETNDATIYYNDDLCGVQSQVFPLMSEGETYYIRIKADCDNINWELNYVGPVSGCTDPSACNFNPIAEIDDGLCMYPGNPECINGPDLMVMPFEDSMYLEIYGNEDGCAIEEGCLTGYGNRSIIRFSTWIKNVGNLDYFIGSVSDNEETSQFEWDECHNHWHYKGYAEYVLFDVNGQIIPVGFKNGFCVMDLECSGDQELGVPAGTFTYGCSIMGISAGCGDIYGPGLSCQWIDITNVPDGEYTFVVRTNWDQDPDALGNIELSYENNWEQTCIGVFTNDDGTRGYYMATDVDGDGINNIIDPDIDGDGLYGVYDDDSDGDGILDDLDETPYGLSECPVYTDCFGVPFGDSQYDCNGVCGGESVTGDINLDSTIDSYDLIQYSLEIIADDWTVSECTDLDSDGEITVTDLSLLVNCVENNNETERDNQSVPCEFGIDILNPNDTVSLSIGEVNIAEQYLDVYILNPNNEVLGYQFEMDNIEITYVENLVSNYPIIPSFSNGSNMILGVSFEDSLIIKHYEPAPLCRVYFSSIQEEACIDTIIDIVNENYENVIVVNNSNLCNSSTIKTDDLSEIYFDIFPNPASSSIDVYINYNQNFINNDAKIYLSNSIGQVSLSKPIKFENNSYSLDVSKLSNGLYFVCLEIGQRRLMKKLFVE